MDGKRDCFEMYKLWATLREEQLNCASCQRNLDNEQEEGSSLIDKELEVYVGDNIRITKGNGILRISGLLGGAGMVGLLSSI